MESVAFLEFAIARLPQLWLRTGEHLILTGLSTGIAVLLGIPLGILASRIPALQRPLLGATGILQTVPSLAMLAILLALTGKIGAVPAVIALSLYALLPIVRNTVTGIQGIPPSEVEAARGIGMTPRQELWMVSIPLSLPVIAAGVRTAAVAGVGIATLSAFIGAGGLGQFINRGLALSNNHLILLGAVPAAILALVVDFSIGAVVWALQPRRQRHLPPSLRRALRVLAFGLPVFLGIAGWFAYIWSGGPLDTASTTMNRRSGPGVVIASKNFTEQLILGEIMARLIESRTDLRVIRQLNLGGTMICHNALLNGEIDLYPEYTGTALTAILKKEQRADPEETLRFIRRTYRERFDLRWLPPFGFNNTYALAVRRDDDRMKGLNTISDLVGSAGELRAGFTSEFAERPDGYPGLKKAYGINFGQVKDLDPTLMYEALHRGEVDVICAFSTDGRINAYDLRLLDDDRDFFPDYYAAPVVRAGLLELHPEILTALAPLAGSLDDALIRRLNYSVDGEKLFFQEVVERFLDSRNLLGNIAPP